MTSKYKRIRKVLIVEDNVFVREALQHCLEDLELSYIALSNGKEAVDILSSTPIDLLITDFRMPEMNGVELLNWCRSNKIHIPVIFLSANADLVPKEQVALSDCCATLMFKPINMDVFIAAIGAADSRSHHEDCLHHRDMPVK